jgi:hypothetical protein
MRNKAAIEAVGYGIEFAFGGKCWYCRRFAVVTGASFPAVVHMQAAGQPNYGAAREAPGNL